MRHVALQAVGVNLLLNMADLPFYRPAIRHSAVATAVTDMVVAGCLEVRSYTAVMQSYVEQLYQFVRLLYPVVQAMSCLLLGICHMLCVADFKDWRR